MPVQGTNSRFLVGQRVIKVREHNSRVPFGQEFGIVSIAYLREGWAYQNSGLLWAFEDELELVPVSPTPDPTVGSTPRYRVGQRVRRARNVTAPTAVTPISTEFVINHVHEVPTRQYRRYYTGPGALGGVWEVDLELVADGTAQESPNNPFLTAWERGLLQADANVEHAVAESTVRAVSSPPPGWRRPGSVRYEEEAVRVGNPNNNEVTLRAGRTVSILIQGDDPMDKTWTMGRIYIDDGEPRIEVRQDTWPNGEVSNRWES